MLNLCFRCFCMIFMCNRLRKLQWKLKFSVCDIFGLYCSDVLLSLSFFSDLCSVLYWLVFIGYRLVNICGLIFLKFGSGVLVLCGVMWVMVLFILVVFSFLMFVMIKFICLVDKDLCGIDFGENMFICFIKCCVLVVISRILFLVCSVLFIMCISIIMLIQLLNYELMISVCSGVVGLFLGVGILVISVFSMLVMFMLVLVEQCVVLVVLMLMMFLIFWIVLFGLVVGRLILLSIGIIFMFSLMVV